MALKGAHQPDDIIPGWLDLFTEFGRLFYDGFRHTMLEILRCGGRHCYCYFAKITLVFFSFCVLWKYGDSLSGGMKKVAHLSSLSVSHGARISNQAECKVWRGDTTAMAQALVHADTVL